MNYPFLDAKAARQSQKEKIKRQKLQENAVRLMTQACIYRDASSIEEYKVECDIRGVDRKSFMHLDPFYIYYLFNNYGSITAHIVLAFSIIVVDVIVFSCLAAFRVHVPTTAGIIIGIGLAMILPFEIICDQVITGVRKALDSVESIKHG